MSTHPNAILLLCLKPNDLARKTFRSICAELGAPEDDPYPKIAGENYHMMVMEDSYDESHQIRADEGDIVLWDMATYGYGERIAWEKLEAQKKALEEWARGICERYQCTASFFITANYW